MQVRNKLDIFISTNTYAVARTLLVVSHLSLFSIRPILPGEIGAAASWRLRKRCYEGSARADRSTQADFERREDSWVPGRLHLLL